jgi:hypothetical protein
MFQLRFLLTSRYSKWGCIKTQQPLRGSLHCRWFWSTEESFGIWPSEITLISTANVCPAESIVSFLHRASPTLTLWSVGLRSSANFLEAINYSHVGIAHRDCEQSPPLTTCSEGCMSGWCTHAHCLHLPALAQQQAAKAHLRSRHPRCGTRLDLSIDPPISFSLSRSSK